MGIHIQDPQKVGERERDSGTLALTLVVGACVTSIGLLIFEPAIVGFVAAVLTAIAWCIWIERHPDADSAPDADADADDHPPIRTHVLAALILAAVSTSALAQTAATAGDANPAELTLTGSATSGGDCA